MKKKALIILCGAALALISGPTVWAQGPGLNQTQSSAYPQAIALYEAAKKSIYNKKYAAVVEMLRELTAKDINSAYGQEGLYWLGYSLDKMAASLENTQQRLEMKQDAIERLNNLLNNFPTNSWAKDAKILQVQIAEDLVRNGMGKYLQYINGGLAGGVGSGVLEGASGGVLGGTLGEVRSQKTTDPDIELKLVALDALMGMDAEKAFPILEKMVREEKRLELREKALFVLSQSDEAKIVPILADIAAKDSEAEMRRKAIFWLGQRDDEASLTALLKIYDTTEAKLKDNLLMAFAQSDNPKAKAKVFEIARTDKDPETRSKAIFWLGQTGDPAALKFFEEILLKK